MKVNFVPESVNRFRQLEIEIGEIRLALERGDFYSLDLYLMEEKQVLDYLKISRSTLFNYREKGIIKAYQFFGRNIYFRHEIYEAVLHLLSK